VLRHFGIPLRSAEQQVQADQGALPNQVFQPLPKPTGPAPYRMALAGVLPAATMAAIQKAGRTVFHCVGDTGGIRDPQPQISVVDTMLGDLSSADPPQFFYHLGDVVYYNGQKNQYYPQFYEPYSHYTLPILAIPGNHDGDAINAQVEPSLAGFVENFCATAPHMTPEAQDSQRDAMTQPNVYWTLQTPLLTIIGLYSNCPDGGVIQPDQAGWLESELAAAAKTLPVIVALHHPIYSADSVHGGNSNLAAILDKAVQQSGRIPDAVFTGHVHNYQRFVRKWGQYQVPYIVAGAGGYHNLHAVAATANGQPPKLPWQLPAPWQDSTLVTYCDNKFGFMRVAVTAQQIQVQYVAVTPSAVAGQAPGATVFDKFTIDLTKHTVS
jgi:hypothetical protein